MGVEETESESERAGIAFRADGNVSSVGLWDNGGDLRGVAWTSAASPTLETERGDGVWLAEEAWDAER